MGAPLLPLALADLVGDVKLPQWVCETAALDSGTTADVLGRPLTWESPAQVDPRLLNFAVRLAQSREQKIADLAAISFPWHSELDPEQVPWLTRTRNCLRNEGLLSEATVLSTISFQELGWISGMGMRSILDFAVTAEVAIMQFEMPLPVQDIDGESDLEGQLKYLIATTQQAWVDQVSGSDPRFTSIMRSGVGTLGLRIEVAIEKVNAREIGELVRLLPKVEERLEKISELDLEDALGELFESLAPRQLKRKKELMARLGWLGEPPITLEVCGNLLEVTRERVRQIQAKIIRRVSQYPVFLPQLDEAIRIFEDAAPIPAGDAPNLLIEAGICSSDFSAESVIAAASDLQRTTSLGVRKIKGKRILVSDEDERATSRLFTVARTQSGASGATNVTEVLAQIEEEDGSSIDSGRAAVLLENMEKINFLDSQWFWMPGIPKERNRLRNISRRMLSVASPMSVSKLRGGVRREYSFRNSAGSFKWTLLAPPINIMTEWYKQHPEFRVDESGNVTHVDHLESRKELGDVDQALVEVLRSSPTTVLDRSSIREACLSRGINPHSLEVALTYSAVLDHVDTNIWTLRGVVVDPASIAVVRDLNAQKPRHKRVRDFGWTSDGNVWISVVTPAYTYMSVFGVPGAIKKFLAGQKFRALSHGGKDVGNVGITDAGTAYGYQPFLKQFGADEGDTFLLEFDLEKEIVILRLGDESLLDQVT